MIEMMHRDCMEYMATLPDKAFELAIVDPPYGIAWAGCFDSGSVRRANGTVGKTRRSVFAKKSWDDEAPTAEYFRELIRVSVNQIIWGGNYFDLGPSRCVICWDKKQRFATFSAWEMAWTSFDSPASLFEFDNKGFMGEGASIHPTQKPVALYKWLLSRYAKPGDRILDTHGGSGSICIACHDLGYDLTWMELDADYYKAACERYQRHAAQGSLFEPEPQKTFKQGDLL